MRTQKLHALLMMGVLSLAPVAYAQNQSNGYTYTSIDVPGAVQTLAHGINSQGQIVGEFMNTDGSFGFLLKRGHFTAITVPGSSSPAFALTASTSAVRSWGITRVQVAPSGSRIQGRASPP